jgi:F-type H+-transporting ATPase subunit a
VKEGIISAASGLDGNLFAAAQKEADFMIHGVFQYTLFGQELWITTTHIALFIISFVLIVLAVCVRVKMAHAEEVPGTVQNIAEFIVEALDHMVENIMGENGKKFLNYIGTIFIFIILCNLSGLVGLRPPTADYGVTLPLGLITFGLIQYNGFKAHKFGHVTALFKPIPLLFPINLIGEIAVPLSLSLRLFGNIMSGTVMMGLIYGLLPIFVKLGIPAVLHVYFDIFSGAIQTYVFCMLTMVYVNDKL